MCDPVTAIAANAGITKFIDKTLRKSSPSVAAPATEAGGSPSLAAPSVAALESIKNAPETASQARSDMDRKQSLRRGLMSTFTRYGSTAAPSLAGKANTLGGK